ncbi:hypothetical protein [Loktanella sp. Alg231-35]|uniref:hypothetical protein n=1 Tax=Loktanella sp. Alg231-35 TaxID=1922220 RepID=UPI000D55D34D|nr:hypothetical protein [Loktanella sp. Alg231-35]
MQIAFHIGANCTDEDRLLKSIFKNADVLLQNGIAVPGPGKYRKLIRETLQQLDGALPTPDTRDILIDAIVEDDSIDRIVLTNDNFIAVPKRVFDHGLFYPQTEMKLRGLAQIFDQDALSLFYGIRNPASFLQEVATRAGVADIATYLGLLTPDELRWSDVIARIRRAAPNALLTVWCNEDTPLIWEQLIRLHTGLPPEAAVTGQYDLLAQIVTSEGMETLARRAAEAPPASELSLQNLIADVIEEFAVPGQIEDAIEWPELDAQTVADLTEAYEEDLEVIAQMEGVTLILPFT